MNDVPDTLIDFINTGGKFLVAGHKEPDGDCVGSQLGLCSLLKRIGKEAIPCSPGPFKRTEVKQYEDIFCLEPGEDIRKGAKVILCDCSSPERTEGLTSFLKGLPLAIIDHHIHSGFPSEFKPDVSYIRQDASSTTILVLYLMKAFGLTPTEEEAALLLLGLCTDTGFFRHSDTNSAETFEAAALLVRAGANPKKAFHAMYGGKSLDSRYLIGQVLGRAESYFDGKLVISTEEYEETCRFGKDGRDSDALYQLFQTVKDIEAIVIIRQEKPDRCTVGLRSLDKVDVSSIARSLGGGGHKNAAGISIMGTIPEVKEKLLIAFEEHF